MATNYPGALDTTTQLPNDQTDATLTNRAGVDHAQEHVNLSDSVRAIEGELGIQPRGLYASTVRERFEIAAYKNQSCKFATTANLAATYANGTAGVGATLTASPAAVAPTTDGQTWVVGDRVLVKNQTTAAQNGIYTVTQITSPWILTRAIDADTATKIADCKVLVDQGTANSDTEWLQSGTGITMGTTSLYFRRHMPMYGSGNPRSLWAPGSGPAVAQPVMETVPRQCAMGQWTVALSATTQHLIGGIVCPAGRTVSNIGFLVAQASAAPSVSWFALARQTDRLVMAHTANSTSAPTTGTNTRPFVTPWTPIEDTPVWVVMSWVNATTSMIMAAVAGTAQSMATPNFASPVIFGTNAVTPTTTVPTDNSTVITAATAGMATSAVIGFPYFYLT